MPTYNIMSELSTGRVFAIGKDGRQYPLEVVHDALRAAERGDAAAQAIARQVDLSIDDEGLPRDRASIDADIERSIHDCPLCAEAAARGTVPVHTSDAVRTSPAGVITYFTRAERTERRAQARAVAKAVRRAERAAERAAFRAAQRPPGSTDPPN